MATLINNKVTFSGGEALPQVGSEAYKQAQAGTLPTSSYTNTPVNTTIDSSSLGNVTPMKVSPTTTANSAVGLSAEITGNINNEVKNDDVFQAQIEKQAKERETALASSKKTLGERLGLVKSQSEITSDAYSQKNELGTTVNETSKKIRDANAKINAIDIRTNEQLKAIESAGGTTLAQSGNQIRAIQRQASTDKADLYIEKLMAQGDYDTAKSIADRKVDAILEQDRIDLDKLKFDYEENKDLFTKAEQRQFETMQAERERAFQKKDTELKTVESLALDALQNGAPPSVVAQMRKEGTVDSAIRTGGQYINAIARNEARVKELVESGKLTNNGEYTPKQLTSLSKLNQDVSKNATYSKTTSMRNYGDNVIASLQLGSGVGDISAINQFQKVIDEGAVTRDQDVKLIQGSQSLLNSLKTKIKKLEKGEQLSPELRQQMRTAVEAMYSKQVEALQKDPYIKSKTKEAGLYGLNANDTILGELGAFTQESTTQNSNDPLGIL